MRASLMAETELSVKVLLYSNEIKCSSICKYYAFLNKRQFYITLYYLPLNSVSDTEVEIS